MKKAARTLSHKSDFLARISSAANDRTRSQGFELSRQVSVYILVGLSMGPNTTNATKGRGITKLLPDTRSSAAGHKRGTHCDAA